VDRARGCSHARAILVFSGGLIDPHARRIAELAARSRLPTMYAFRFYVEAGGLMSYGLDLIENFHRAAIFVDKILKGAKPADLPIEQPTKFELVINMKTAKALGLTIPQSLLVRADEIIQSAKTVDRRTVVGGFWGYASVRLAGIRVIERKESVPPIEVSAHPARWSDGVSWRQ
jgi:hypothetical protein